jgi:hypothetical protein
MLSIPLNLCTSTDLLPFIAESLCMFGQANKTRVKDIIARASLNATRLDRRFP